jgi:hypothetical protein
MRAALDPRIRAVVAAVPTFAIALRAIARHRFPVVRGRLAWHRSTVRHVSSGMMMQKTSSGPHDALADGGAQM